jgi:putative membrane protein
MRWINLMIIALFAAGTIIFAFQNIETITVSFLSFSITVPVAVLVVIVYVLGALTGGSLFALLHRSYRGSAIRS